MSQHDMDITTADANTGVTFRAAVNAALQALASTSSSATAPATTYPNQLWADTASGKLKLRNTANTGWVTLLDLATSLTASNAELNYMDGVTSNVQTQLNGKASLAGNADFTGAGGGTYTRINDEGVDLANTLTTRSNNSVLWRYQEDTYTPILYFGSTAAATYSNQYGRYVVVGSLVIVTVDIAVTSKGSGIGPAAVTLPAGMFTPDGYGAGNVRFLGSSGITTEQIVGEVSGGVIVLKKLSGGVGTNLDESNFTNTSAIRGSFVFTTTD